MPNIKKMIVIGATALTIGAGAAMSAQAQQLTTSYVDSLNWKITDAARNNRISWNEARQLRTELRSVHDLAWRNETGRISRWEYRRLADTVHRIEMRTTRYAYNDGPRRYGYDYGGRHDWRR